MLVTGHGNGMVMRYKKNDYSSLCFGRQGGWLFQINVS